MGFYIEGPAKSKDQFIKDNYSAKITSCPKSFEEVPSDKALICVVDNGFFEVAGFCYNQNEFIAFCSPSDSRPKTWLLMDLEKAKELTGFKGD